ncbi:unnamed protein product [Allacma fusca]|uniref:Clarin-3 n=1 Tax=Allacma fusca TaxID=39272 RepID=A0A8J2P3B0_9HEXA|nr:unnamed protein product [Allacma fusca]
MALYRKFNNLIFFTIAGSILSIIILGVSFGTKNWYESKASVSNNAITSTLTVHYGLFAGAKTIQLNSGDLDAGQKRELKIVCEAKENACMFSCGYNSDVRKRNLVYYLEGGANSSDTTFCIETPSTSDISRFNRAGTFASNLDKSIFLNFALWLLTLLFLVGGILFSAISGILALVNTYRAPSQPILSVYGLYIWNGLSAGCTLMVMIFWGVAFGIGLKDHAAISDTLSNGLKNDSAKLGYSFWILLLPEFLCLANIGILRYRTWKIHQIETTHRVVDDKITNHETLLF